MTKSLDKTTKTVEKAQLRIILLIIFIGFIGASLPYPIFSPLFLTPTHNSIIPYEWDYISRSIWLGVVLAAYPLGQFLGSPILGGCSDKYGRRIILMISLTISALGHCFSAIAINYQSLSLLLTSRFLTGLMEGNIAIVQAMVGDLKFINKEESFGKISAIGSVGYVMGPLLGGIFSDSKILSDFSYALPFYLATIISLVALILTILKLYPARTKNYDSHNSHISILERFNIFKRLYLLCTNKQLKYLLLASVIYTFGVDTFYEFGPAFLTIFWSTSPVEIAIYNTVLCIGLVVGSRWLPNKLEFFISERKIILLAIISTGIAFLLITIILNKILVLMLFGIAGIGIAVTTTKITIQISNVAHETVQGEALGSQLGLRMLGNAIACSSGGFIIAQSATLPIIISSIFTVFAFGIYCQFTSKIYKM
ncbi:MAG: MFS transporter [Gammaproteobacteria bacterium]|nr:MFS transporter [Gammaproteobacteria bacterium]